MRRLVGSDKLKVAVVRRMPFRISLKRSFAKNDWKKRNLRRVTRSDKLKVAVLGRVPFRISLKNIAGNACCKKNVWK